MTALTLVLGELAGLDPEEFLNVRMYHSAGPDFYRHQRAALRPASPTSSESSGICSLTGSATASSSSSAASTSDEEETSKPALRLQRVSTERRRNDGCSDAQQARKLQQATVTKKLQEEKIDKNVRIMYNGRDILNLERNTQPHKWQLASPLFGFLNPYVFVNYRSYYRFDGDTLVTEYSMQTCEKCDFYQPSKYA